LAKVSAAERIVAVAIDEFSRHGFAAVTMRRIASKCHLTMPAIYFYFKNKRALYLHCYLKVYQEGNVRPLAALKEPGTATQRLYRYLVALAAEAIENPNSVKFTYRAILDEDKEFFSSVHSQITLDQVRLLRSTIAEVTGKPTSFREPIALYGVTLSPIHFSILGGEVEADLRGLANSPQALARFVLETVYPNVAATFDFRSR
jgi:AcrR family transcriptional regulator